MIVQAVWERRAARRKWQKLRSPTDKTQFNRLSKRVKALIVEVDNSTFQSKLLALDATKQTDYALWKIARKKPPTYSPPIRATSGSDLEKANVFASHLKKVFQPNEMTTDINPARTEIDGPAIIDFTDISYIPGIIPLPFFPVLQCSHASALRHQRISDYLIFSPQLIFRSHPSPIF